MAIDQALQRAAGIIFWKMERGLAPEDAMAFAGAREIDLEEADLRTALDMARAAKTFADLCQVAPNSTRVCDLLDAAGVRWKEENSAV